MSQESNTMPEHPRSPSNQRLAYEGDIDLLQLIGVLWQGKYLIIITTFIAAVISVFIALRQPNIYRAEALLVTDEAGSAGGLAGLASQYGGLASLAGISLPAGEASEKAIGMAKLQSRQFLSGFAERHNILPDLMAAKSYNGGTGELIYDPEIYDLETET